MICKKLAGLLGPCEYIDVETKEDSGSSFTFYIYPFLEKIEFERNRYISVYKSDKPSSGS